MVASYLRSELSKIGFNIIEDSPNVLSGAFTYHHSYGETYGVEEASIVLKKDSDQIVWRYRDDGLGKSNKDFAGYIAKQISATLRD